MAEERADRKLREIFGVDPWSEPDEDADDRADERLREREYQENRPPHHEDR